MNNSTQIARLAMALSTVAVTTLAACSDSTSPSALRAPSTASFDHGGQNDNSGRGNQNDNQNDNQNQNQNDQRTRVTIALAAAPGSPFARAHGKAQLDTRVGENQLEIEIEDVPVGTVVNFFVGATKVGSATVGALGEAELELNSKRGDVIPATPAGTVVSVKTAAGAVIASGTF